MSHRQLAAALGLLTTLAACGGTLRETAPARPHADSAAAVTPDAEGARGGVKELALEPVQIEVVQGGPGGGTTTVTDARSLFDEGNDALMQRRYADAVARYEQLVRDFPASQLVGPARYNAGLAEEEQGHWPKAVDHYREAWARATTGTLDKREAGMRLGAALAESKQFAESVQIFEAYLALEGLTADERLEALARLGYALVEQADYVGAEEILRQALQYHQIEQQRGPLASGYYASMAQFYLAVIPHRQFRALPLRYPETQMARDLEHKSELFLIAYDRYMLLLKSYPNRYWTTAAIYQLGVMHKEFWDAFFEVPMPPQLDAAARAEYVKLFNENDQLGKLLGKSLFFHEKNVVLSREAGIESVWVMASDERARELRALIARQTAGEAFAPGTVPGGKTRGGDEGPAPRAAATGEAPDYVPPRTNL